MALPSLSAVAGLTAETALNVTAPRRTSGDSEEEALATHPLRDVLLAGP